MDSRTEERVADWDSRPFSDGYESLRDLAASEFSGVVETTGTSLFMLNGRVVGVTGGSLSAFESAEGTIHTAPHPSLPLLFAMREQGGEERAKYYTNDTPISEANDTLSAGSFTGYIELSENVLSGDYYVVYYGGRSMSCAFVGNQERLLTDDEAFERADDEVGIYTVWDVEIDVTEIPGGDDQDGTADATTAGAAGVGGQHAADEPVDPAGAETESPGDEASTTRSVDSDEPPIEDASPAAGDGQREGPGDGTADVGGAPIKDAEGGTAGTPEDGDAVARPPPDEPIDSSAGDDAPSDGTSDPAGSESRERGAREHDERGASGSNRAATGGGQDATGRRSNHQPSDSTDRTDSGGADDTGDAMAEVPDEVMAEVESEAQSQDLAEEAAWRETTKIPSINPDRTTSEDTEDDPIAAGPGSGTSPPDRSRTAQNAGGSTSEETRRDSRADTNPPAGGRAGDGRADAGRSSDATQSPRANDPNAGTNAPADSASTGQAVDGARISELESELEDVRAERDELASERDDLQDQNEELRARVQSLESEIETLESELASMQERLANAGGVVTGDSVELSESEALEGTNLFVRYGSKSATTLEDVHDSDVTVADLESNLRLEYHTGFDAENAVVNGRAYEDFLYDSIEYGFVEWFVYDLVFEIRDTGNESGLGDLYAAFPSIDRIELHGDVSLRYTEGGDEHREQSKFDVVVRDRMGNPLTVATVNDGRDPATEDMMVDLQERSARVKRTSDALAGAFMVTSSYFNPGALEIAEEATSGSLLSRDSKKSYVKLSRKNGYHLCLVETRNGEFHVNVPEL